MALKPANPTIDVTMRRVSIGKSELEDICEAMQFEGDELLIRADRYEANSFADLVSDLGKLPYIYDLLIVSTFHSLSVALGPRSTHIGSVGTPSNVGAYAARTKIEHLLEPRRRSLLSFRDLLVHLVIGLAFITGFGFLLTAVCPKRAKSTRLSPPRLSRSGG
jgi:hypothetical protein